MNVDLLIFEMIYSRDAGVKIVSVLSVRHFYSR